MPPAMRQKARQVTEKAIICAMLDGMDVLFLSMNDGPAPYTVPLNFGYEFDRELVFYFHCAKAGYKLERLRCDPNVCVSAASFISYAGGSVRGHLHDYRSVIARGRAERIDPQTDAAAFRRAMEAILMHNGRDAADADSPVMAHVEIWAVRCRAEDVTAKAEITPKSVEDVPFLPPKGDGMAIDDSHILDMKKTEL